MNPKLVHALDGKAVVETSEMVKRAAGGCAWPGSELRHLCARPTPRESRESRRPSIEPRPTPMPGRTSIFTEALTCTSPNSSGSRRVDHAAAGKYDRVRKVRVTHRQTAVRDRLQRITLPGDHAAIGDVRRRGRSAEISIRRNTSRTAASSMQHRSRLYELLRYAEYNEFDSDIFNFSSSGAST